MDIDVVGTTSGSNNPGRYISYTVRNIHSNSGLTINSQNGFSCSSPLSNLIIDDVVSPTIVSAIQNCAAYGKLSLLTGYAVPNQITGQVTPDDGTVIGSVVFGICDPESDTHIPDEFM